MKRVVLFVGILATLILLDLAVTKFVEKKEQEDQSVVENNMKEEVVVPADSQNKMPVPEIKKPKPAIPQEKKDNSPYFDICTEFPDKLFKLYNATKEKEDPGDLYPHGSIRVPAALLYYSMDFLECNAFKASMISDLRYILDWFTDDSQIVEQEYNFETNYLAILFSVHLIAKNGTRDQFRVKIANLPSASSRLSAELVFDIISKKEPGKCKQWAKAINLSDDNQQGISRFCQIAAGKKIGKLGDTEDQAELDAFTSFIELANTGKSAFFESQPVIFTTSLFAKIMLGQKIDCEQKSRKEIKETVKECLNPEAFIDFHWKK